MIQSVQPHTLAVSVVVPLVVVVVVVIVVVEVVVVVAVAAAVAAAVAVAVVFLYSAEIYQHKTQTSNAMLAAAYLLINHNTRQTYVRKE